MAQSKARKLVDLLIQKTRRKSLDWETAIAGGEFAAIFTDSTITVSRKSGELGWRHVLEIANEDGDVVDSFDEEYFDDEILGVDSEWKNQLKELYDLARRNALKSEEVLDSLLLRLER